MLLTYDPLPRARMEKARGRQDEDTEVPTDREEQANERRAGGRRRVQETTWDPDPDSAIT